MGLANKCDLTLWNTGPHCHGARLSKASHMLGETADTGREIEQSQGDMKSKYVPGGREDSFFPPLVARSFMGVGGGKEEEEGRLIHTK